MLSGWKPLVGARLSLLVLIAYVNSGGSYEPTLPHSDIGKRPGHDVTSSPSRKLSIRV